MEGVELRLGDEVVVGVEAEVCQEALKDAQAIAASLPSRRGIRAGLHHNASRVAGVEVPQSVVEGGGDDGDVVGDAPLVTSAEVTGSTRSA